MKSTTFENEVECITHNHEKLVLADVRGKRTFVAVTRDGFRTDFPIFYTHNRSTAWDHPEWFSRKFKDKVHAHFLTAWRD